jgi:chorismate synthase
MTPAWYPRRAVMEAMVALVLADQALLHNAQCRSGTGTPPMPTR